MRNARLVEAQAGIKIARRDSNNLRYADDTTLRAESKEELKSLLMKVKEQSEKVGLKKSTFKKLRSWYLVPSLTGRETMETVRDFIFLGSKITAMVTAAMKLKGIAPWKKSYDQPRQHIKKQRHYFANKGPSSQSNGFSSSHV